MKSIVIALLVLCALFDRVSAQASVEGTPGQASALLAHAKYLYERRELDRALPLLRELVAPGTPMDMTLAQRVEAFKYLGAAHALAGRRDSAITHFNNALAFDPFTDVRPPEFSREQAAIFAEARKGMFAVALRPIAATRVELRSDSMKFTAVATHLARVKVALVRGDSVRIPLYEGDMEGTRVFSWSGMTRRGQPVPTGSYRVSIVAQSRVLDWQDSTSASFNVAYEMPDSDTDASQEKSARPDTATPPPAAVVTADTTRPKAQNPPLPQMTQPQGNPRGDVVKALAVAAGAILVGSLVANDHLGGGGSQARIVAGLATVTGIVAIVRARNRTPPAAPAPTPPPAVRTPPPVMRRPEPANPPAVATRRSRVTKPVLIITPAALEP